MVDELTPEHTVVTYDRRGWGRSRDDPPPTSLADHAQDAIDALAGRRATIVGHSYGGVVGLMTAVLRPTSSPRSRSSSRRCRSPTGGPTTTR